MQIFRKELKKNNLFIGLMSGTSMDGIDVALMDVSTHHLIEAMTIPYSADISTRLRQLTQETHTTLKEVNQLHVLLGTEFANAVQVLLNNTDYDAQDIMAIGSHGQTVCHDTSVEIPYTMQLGSPYVIAEVTGIPVVADFRARDLVLGGQGAPLAPLYHRECLQTDVSNFAVVNIGGIANVTYITQGGHMLGYDVGPGNGLLDAFIYQHLGKSYDSKGAWAESGTVNGELLERLLADPYFQKKTPKSLGREYYSLQWLQTYLPDTYQPQDIQATLLAFTAHAIARDILVQPIIEKVWICGGGVHNDAMMYLLKKLMKHIPVDSTEKIGRSPDYLEAMMCAWFASQYIKQQSFDLTQLTGSTKPHLLGVLYPI